MEKKLNQDKESHRLWHRLNERFVKAMATYHLIEDDDHILVGLSGGKDSLLLLELLAKRSRILHPRFKVEALHVRMANIHYETDSSYLQQFCDELGVKLHVLTTSFEVINGSRKGKTPCFLCSWNRRKQMFNLAQELGCNKIALGHHQDDLLHTALMNLTFQGRFDTMPALLKMRKMPLSIIRPLCMIEEKDIKQYAELQGYQKQQKLCPYETNSHRADIKHIYDAIEQMSPEARYSMWNALNADNKLIEE
ncbi:MAG: tRNA 2-thiocytidine biosynthesis protein TtcA [Prevotella ruminicola]|uniref:tRNA 2-thiocytidine biosynthesis protein TtcA n=1 Tax=Xylanibacter ruminicola TaxID=839 RepID=A0A9D5S6P7_XYLRU|nr:tRNA 2-thiocytidine biosynthesis protein TtcA [Xylanibacter ruminicola]